MLGLGLWLLVRRIAGSLAQPLDATGLIAAAVWLSVLSGGLRWAVHAATGSNHRRSGMDRVAGAAAIVGPLTCGVALSLPGSPPSGLVAFWCVLLTTEAAWFAVERVRGRVRTFQDAVESDAGQQSLGGSAVPHKSCPPPFSLEASAAESEVGDLLHPGESQRISRSQDAAGGEIVTGLVRCSFAPNERHRDIHLAFCPPLRRIPQFSAEQVEGPPARIRAVLVETFGVGLEVKLAAVNTEPTWVQVQFFACEEPIAEEAG